jgi:hypothetical protein
LNPVEQVLGKRGLDLFVPGALISSDVSCAF